MFRLENNVPHIYVNESRDFQLLCRLFDAAFASVKYSTDSLTHASDTAVCNDALLDLLRYKVGLFSPLSCTKDQLRMIIESFPFMIRTKGSIQSVSAVLNLFHRMFGDGNNPPEFNVDTVANETVLRIIFPYNLKNTQLLVELLKLILPAGIFTDIEIVVATVLRMRISLDDRANVTVRDYRHQHVVNPGEIEVESDDMEELIGSVGLTTIVDESIADEYKEN